MGGLDSGDNSLLTDSCERLILSPNRIYQRPIHILDRPCVPGHKQSRPLDLFTLILTHDTPVGLILVANAVDLGLSWGPVGV